MATNLDEFSTTSRLKARGVQKDTKLKFNNLLSCVAVAVLPHGGGELIGVHFSVASTRRDNELDDAFGRMTALLAGSTCDAYVVAPVGQYETTNLLAKLKKVAAKIHLSKITPNQHGEAEADCKMEVSGSAVVISIRPKTKLLLGADKQPILKPKYAGGAARPNTMDTGKRIHQSDRDAKPWARIQPVQIHPPL